MTDANHAYRLSYAHGQGALELKGFTSISGPEPLNMAPEIRALFDALPQITGLAIMFEAPAGRKGWDLFQRHADNEV